MAAHTKAPSVPFERMGAYRVVTEIGAGPSGEVYYAEHERVGERVAIKLLDHRTEGEQAKRFFEAATQAASLHHPSIVQVRDYGVHEGRSYLVMELLEGESLGARLERGAGFSLAEMVELAETVADALDAAASKGVSHGSLTLENIFLGSDDAKKVVLLDFGIGHVRDYHLDDQSALADVIAAILPDKATPPHVRHALDKARSEEPFESLGDFVAALHPPIKGLAPSDPAQLARRDLEHRQSVVVGRELSKMLARRFAYGRIKLPAIGAIAASCLQSLDDPNVRLPELADTLSRDPLVAAALLKLVNSPMFGSRGKIQSVQQAVARLGIRRTRAFILETSVRQVFRSPDPAIRRSFRLLWQHCVAVGVLARRIAEHLDEGPDPEEAYLAGLLHDVGKPIVAAYLLDAERSLLSALGSSWVGDSLFIKILEQTHLDAARALAKEWDLPEYVTTPIEQGDLFVEPHDAIGNVIRYANALAQLEGLDVGEIDIPYAHDVALEGRLLLGSSEALENVLLRDLRTDVTAMTSG